MRGHRHMWHEEAHRAYGRGQGREGGRGRGGGGWQQADLPDAGDAPAWIAGRLPDGWFTGPAEASIDRDEILIIGAIPAPESEAGTPAERAAAESGRISRFREETREDRIKVALETQHRYGRKVSWGATCGETTELFTTVSAPVMTRLRQPERQVLDTLVDSGVARSRSDALAWCVRLVGNHADEWLAGLRDAMSEVERLRAEGPVG